MLWHASNYTIPQYFPLIWTENQIGYWSIILNGHFIQTIRYNTEENQEANVMRKVYGVHSCPTSAFFKCVCWLFKLLIESMFSDRLNWIPRLTVYSMEFQCVASQCHVWCTCSYGCIYIYMFRLLNVLIQLHFRFHTYPHCITCSTYISYSIEHGSCVE